MHHKAREAFLSAIDQGWHDPRKLGHQSAKTAILRQEALSSIAQHFGVDVTEVEIIGEPGLATFYAVHGLLQTGHRLIHSVIDRKEIYAIAQNWESVSQVAVNGHGKISTEDLLLAAKESQGVFALQIANGETGVMQSVEKLISTAENFQISCDYTQTLPHLSLPSRWSTASFNAASWQGPAGVGVILINRQARWKNPIPHIGTERTPNTVSLPLLLASAVALEEWRKEAAERSVRLRSLNAQIRQAFTQINNSFIAGHLDDSMEHLISASFDDVEGEELLRSLEVDGISVDSGSACSADNLRPSHVLASMGLPTHGNVRITLHPEITDSEVIALIESVRRNVEILRK
ncbi:unannotated protein [freshwater metagenome]|uniref:Unannotated protein n=1 Tax=freshwater metagenome TaxID=449393 RepID=A0A6J7Q9X3_9ZZZZ